MKRILLATSILTATAGFASAEITLSGDARMGIIGGSGVDTGFTSRARVKFTMSGETDGGLSFGASLRADNAADDTSTIAKDGAVNGRAGEVFISGAFGKLSMGDVDGAANSALGQVSGVGLTGLGDLNEIYYNNGGNYDTEDPSARYEYSTGALTVYAAATQPSAAVVAYGVGVKYVFGNYTVAAAYEQYDDGDTFTDVYVGGTAVFGAVTVKAVYGNETEQGTSFNVDQWAASIDYAAGALTLTAFYADDSEIGGITDGQTEGYGVGASYDLGGGASMVGGYVKNVEIDEDSYDLGVSFSF